MSDHVPGGLWQPADEPPVRRAHVAREAAFQMQVVHFLERVLVPPFFYTAIAHENELSENARARARARGVKPGVPDLFIFQYPACRLWLELKWGNNKPSDAQKFTGQRLAEAGVDGAFIWTVHQVLVALEAAGFQLHGNARNLATEYQQRAEAAVLKAEQRAPSRTSTNKPKRTGRPTKRALRFAAARVLG